MRLGKYGVVLRTLAEPDLEMVRQWRNAPHVQEGMEFREEIKPDAQRGWFESLDAQHNLYFVIEVGEMGIGVVQIKEIDWEMKKGEAGIFIGEAAFLRGQEAVFAVLTLMDFAFLTLKMKTLTAKVKADSRETLAFNAQLGYRQLPGQEGAEFVQLEVQAEAYLKKAERLRKFSAKIAADAGKPHLEFAASDAFWQERCR